MPDLLDMFLDKLPTAPEDAMSTAELCEKTGYGRGYVDDRLNELHSEGRLGVGRKAILKRDGTRAKVPAYWLVESDE